MFLSPYSWLILLNMEYFQYGRPFYFKLGILLTVQHAFSPVQFSRQHVPCNSTLNLTLSERLSLLSKFQFHSVDISIIQNMQAKVTFFPFFKTSPIFRWNLEGGSREILPGGHHRKLLDIDPIAV